MQKKEAVAPIEVPETAATYERTNPHNSVKGSETTPPKTTSEQERPTPLPTGNVKVAGDMKTEVPTGWDMAPNDIQEAERKRHPRPDGVGGSDHASANQSAKRTTELGG